MALSAEERARIRAHLGYTNVRDPAAQFGVPHVTRFQQTLELNFSELDPAGEKTIREALCELDRLDERRKQLTDSALEFQQTGSVKYQDPGVAFALLDQQRDYWRGRLADALDSFPNPTSVQDNITARAGGVVEPSGF